MLEWAGQARAAIAVIAGSIAMTDRHSRRIRPDMIGWSARRDPNLRPNFYRTNTTAAALRPVS